MHTQIRLAERQGLLKGPDLSSVQMRAVFLLDLFEQSEKEAALQRELRRSAVQMGWERFSEVFAEYVEENTAPATVEQIDAALGKQGEETDGAYFDFTEADFDPDEAERLFAQMMAEAASGSVSGDSLAGQDGWV